jgi:hypothetical protein
MGDAPFSLASKIAEGSDPQREGAKEPANELIEEDRGPPESRMRRIGTEYMSTKESGCSNAFGVRLGQVTWLLAKKKLTLESKEGGWIAALNSGGA